MDEKQVVARGPHEFRTLVDELQIGDKLNLDDELWMVISVENNVVEVRPLESNRREIQFIGPSSGRLNNAASTRNSGFSKRYSRVEIDRNPDYSWSTEKV